MTILKSNLIRINHLTRLAYQAKSSHSSANFSVICKAFGFTFDEYISALQDCTSAKWVYQSGIKFLKH